MTCIADANVLFPLLVQGHAAYEVAKAWWDEQPDATVGTCLLTRLAVLRLLTNRVAMNGAPVSRDEALGAWHRLSDDPRSFHVDAEPANHEARFVSLVSSREPRRIWGPMHGLPRWQCRSIMRSPLSIVASSHFAD
jgi:predicted nucleic acid-binding protein